MAQRWERQLKVALHHQRRVATSRSSSNSNADAVDDGDEVHAGEHYGRRRGRGHPKSEAQQREEAAAAAAAAEGIATAVLQFRRALCASYSAVLLKDVALGRRHDVEHRLWVVHYHDIALQKSRLKKLPRTSAEWRAMAGAFTRQVAGATKFFSELVRREWVAYRLSTLHIGTSRRRQPEGAMARAVDSVQRLLVSLGDLARYRGTIAADSTELHMREAWYLYRQALQLRPTGRVSVCACKHASALALSLFFRSFS